MALFFDKPSKLITKREWEFIINQLVRKHPFLRRYGKYLERLNMFVKPALEGRTSYGQGIDKVEWERVKDGLDEMLPEELHGVIPDLKKLGDEALVETKGGSLAGY